MLKQQVYAAFVEFLPLIGAGISAATNWFGGQENREQQQQWNETQVNQAALNRSAQYDFAKNAIGWKVADAKGAGIHPLYALGANTVSYSPVSLGGGPDTSMGSALASAGQDISRAMNATATAKGRADAFTLATQEKTLTRMDLENQLLATKLKAAVSPGNPPMPTLDPPGAPTNTFIAKEEDDPQERPKLGAFGSQWGTDPGSSNAEDAEKRYGEVGEFIQGALNMGQDAYYNLPHMSNERERQARALIDRLVDWIKGRR